VQLIAAFASNGLDLLRIDGTIGAAAADELQRWASLGTRFAPATIAS
jgi:hypothetical protein